MTTVETGTLKSKEEIEAFLAEAEDIDSTNDEVKFKESYQKLEGFDSSIELLAFFDPLINTGVVTLHPWQIETSEEICSANGSAKHPYKYCLCASNGSGKDCYVIAPLSLWFILTKIRSRVIITSSSGVQLTNQTEAYISGLGEKINNWAILNIGESILKINKRHITCSLTGSEIILFATDEEGKAEGYHPLEPNSEMMIIVNEAKSVAPEIFRALRRCTGFNIWINVSTPGEPVGDFYNSFELWPNKRRVTYFDCPHLSPEEFESDRRELGEHSPLFRSKWLALFTFIGGRYVINQEKLELLRNKRNLIRNIGDTIRVGIDIALSNNGDESVIQYFRGNKHTKQSIFRNKDATILADNIEKDLINNKIEKSHEHIFADDGGVGRAVIDILRRKGWNIYRVLNQSSPKNKRSYRNRGAELWYKFNRLVEESAIILLEDNKLYSQLASRKYKESTAGIDKLTLQSKKEMISEGLPSPDRADAVILAFTDVKLEDFLDKFLEENNEVKNDSKKMTSEEIEELLIDHILIERKFKAKKASHFSLNSIMEKRKKGLLYATTST